MSPFFYDRRKGMTFIDKFFGVVKKNKWENNRDSIYARKQKNYNFNLLFPMKIQYDKMADAMYIYLKKGKVDRTIKINNRVFADLDKEGNVIGIEMLDVSRQIPKKEIGRIHTEMPVFP